MLRVIKWYVGFLLIKLFSRCCGCHGKTSLTFRCWIFKRSSRCPVNIVPFTEAAKSVDHVVILLVVLFEFFSQLLDSVNWEGRATEHLAHLLNLWCRRVIGYRLCQCFFIDCSVIFRNVTNSVSPLPFGKYRRPINFLPLLCSFSSGFGIHTVSPDLG